MILLYLLFLRQTLANPSLKRLENGLAHTPPMGYGTLLHYTRQH